MKIVVVGAGGHGREIADVIRACICAGARYELVGFVDENPRLHGKRFDDTPVLGDASWLEGKQHDIDLVCGVGAPRAKASVVRRFGSDGFRFEGLIHPRAEVTRTASFGAGAVITAGVVVTNEITIGAHVHLNRNSTVGHDCRLGDFVHLAPGAVLSGHVTVGVGCDIGTCASVIQGKSIGDWSIIGAGAAVTKDVPEHSTAVGVPAKVIKRHQPRKAA